MDKIYWEKYAELVIRIGLNMYKGQCLNIDTGYDDYDFALTLSEEAYKQGAKFVNINVISNKLLGNRLKYSANESLSFIPDFGKIRLFEQLANDWAFVRIDNTSESKVLNNANPDMLETVIKTERLQRRRYLEECSKYKFAWCVIASPNKKWAEEVIKNNPDSYKIFTENIKKILRLDSSDVIKTWKDHNDTLHKRADKLNALEINKLFLINDGCELELSLTKTSRWIGGSKQTPDGRDFIPNLPTEEVFTTPDFRKTKGKIKITRPVKVMETTLNDVWFEFKDGKVVDFGADKRPLLEKFVSSDSNSGFLGEVALVDKNSPINKSGLIFNSILYDENASSHIALGNGYPMCLSNGASLYNADDLKNAGCNVSMVHTDFMYGSDNLCVEAVLMSGEKVTIIKDGSFVV